MARKKQPDRVICIEDRGGSGSKRFRLKYVAGGRRLARGYATLADAEEAGQKYTRKTLPLRTELVDDLITRYRDDMLARGEWQSVSKALASKVARLRKFFEPVKGLPIAMITPAALTKCCKAWDERPAWNTRNDGRLRAKAFFSWCIDAGLIRSSPFSKEHRIAYTPPPKRTIRVDDTRILRSVVDPAAERGDPEAIFVLAGLLLGPRSSELQSARISNLDDNGRVFTYLDTKNKRTVYRVRLPSVLVRPFALLAGAAKERGDDLLFGRHCPRWPARCVRKFAKRADLPGWEKMDARLLRRTKDTIVVESGMAAEVAARETGHTLHVARKHYIADGSEATGRAKALEEMTGNESQNTVPSVAKQAEA